MIADTPFAALVAAHRSGFTAGLEQPEPAECCTELGADFDDEDGGMEMLVYAGVTAFVALSVLVAVFA